MFTPPGGTDRMLTSGVETIRRAIVNPLARNAGAGGLAHFVDLDSSGEGLATVREKRSTAAFVSFIFSAGWVVGLNCARRPGMTMAWSACGGGGGQGRSFTSLRAPPAPVASTGPALVTPRSTC